MLKACPTEYMTTLTSRLERSRMSPVVGACNDTTWYSVLREDLESQGVQPRISLSVVIPYFERVSTLRQTLYSFVQSTYDLRLVEFVIVDDGSRFDHRPDISEYEDLGLRVRYLWQPNLGFRLSAARNLGISHASYDNIILLDCDLAVSPGFLSEHAWPLYISSNIVSIGLRESRVYGGADVDLFKTSDIADIGDFVEGDWRLRNWIDRYPNYTLSDQCWRLCSGGNIGFNRSIFERAGGFSEQFVFWGGEDLEWAYRVSKSGVYFHVNRKAYAYHFESRPGEYQVSRTCHVAEKDNLLRDLVPSAKPEYRGSGGDVPYVSVFVTLFNKSPYLRDALMSVGSATRWRHEIVIVDDGSVDDYAPVVASLPADVRSRIRLHSREHAGVEHTYRDCLSLCRGEFIAQLDADDILESGCIDTLIEVLEGSPYDLAYGKYRKFSDPHTEMEPGWAHPICDRFKSIVMGMYTHPLRVFRSRALARQGGFREVGLEAAVDFSLYSQLLLSCNGVFVDSSTYLYRQVASSLTCAKPDAQIQNTRHVIEANLSAMNLGEYSIVDIAPREYEVMVSAQAPLLVYVDHLGLRAGLGTRIVSDPKRYINASLRNVVGRRS